MNTNAFLFDTNLLKLELFKEFSWLFVQITVQYSKAYFPQYVLFILSSTFRMNWSFYWAQIISNEISH